MTAEMAYPALVVRLVPACAFSDSTIATTRHPFSYLRGTAFPLSLLINDPVKLSEKSRMGLRWLPYKPPNQHFGLRIAPKSTLGASPATHFRQFHPVVG